MNRIAQNSESKTNQDLLHIDEHLSDLALEAKVLFDLLDTHSFQIKKLEKELQKINANFLFKLLIREEKKSILQQPLKKHTESCAGTVYGFWTQDRWYLSWENDNQSKHFRLFLISEEKELIFFDYADRIEQVKIFSSQIKFKKPLIETDIQTRLQSSQYLLGFIDSFKAYLKKCRISIEIDELPF